MKEKDRLKRIRDYLIKQRKARWTQIQNATNIQAKELSYDLKKLIREREIVAEKDVKDRRITWYMLKDENKSLAESKRYDSIKFIENLKDPLYYEAKVEEKGYKVLISLFMEGPAISSKDQEIKRYMQGILDNEAKRRFQNMKLKNILEFELSKRTVTVFAHEVPEERVREDFNRFKEQIKAQALLRKK